MLITMRGEGGVFSIQKKGNLVTENVKWKCRPVPVYKEHKFPSSDEAERYILEQIRNWEDYGFVRVNK